MRGFTLGYDSRLAPEVDRLVIAAANSFTQFVPGHVHLKDLGQLVAREIEQVKLFKIECPRAAAKLLQHEIKVYVGSSVEIELKGEGGIERSLRFLVGRHMINRSATKLLQPEIGA